MILSGWHCGIAFALVVALMPPIRPAKLWRLLGETAREIGVLIVVFVPLESGFQTVSGQVEVSDVVGLVVGGALLILWGVLVEAEE